MENVPEALKKILRIILGFNLASLIRGLRFGLGRFSVGATRSFRSADPFEPADLAALPEVELFTLIGHRSPSVHLDLSPEIDGSLPRVQRLALAALVAAEAPSEVLEIGTYRGVTTRLLAENLASGVVHTVDLPEEFSPENDHSSPIPKDDFHLIGTRKPGEAFKDTPCAVRIRQHFGDSATWDFRNAGSSTFFFIDGSHTYEYCLNDTKKCLELCQDRAVFLWHDCDKYHPGVIKFLAEWRSKGNNVVRIKDTPLAYWEYRKAGAR